MGKSSVVRLFSYARYATKGWAVVVAFVSVVVAAILVVPSRPAAAQTLGDCEAYVKSGQWDAAREACTLVLQRIASAQQSLAGSYCDNCEHSLAEIPSNTERVQLLLGYSRAAYAEGLVMLHFGHLQAAQRWLQQATRSSRSIARYSGHDAIIRSVVPAAAIVKRTTRSHFLPNASQRLRRVSQCRRRPHLGR